MQADLLESSPAQVVRDPERSSAANQQFEIPQVRVIERLAATEIEPDAVKCDRIVAANCIQDLERPAAGDHEVLGDDLEPVDRDRARGGVGIERRTEPEPEARAHDPGSPSEPASGTPLWSAQVLGGTLR